MRDLRLLGGGSICIPHRHRKVYKKIDCLRFAMCPPLAPFFQVFFFCCRI